MKNKSQQRIENKKKKMAALLEISLLNERDRNLKKTRNIERDHSTDVELEPIVKRLRTEASYKTHESQSTELGPSGKPKLSGLELQDLKKMLREKAKKIRNQPSFKLREIGVIAAINRELDSRVPLFFSDLQHLILYSQLGHHSPYSPSRWCALDKFNKLSTTCFIIVESVNLYNFLSNESQFSFISSHFHNRLEVLTSSPNTDIVQELSMVPLTATQVRKYCDKFGNLQTAVEKSTEIFDTVRSYFPIENTLSETNQDISLPESDAFPRTQLLLSGWQMVEENYPLPIKGLIETKYKGYVMTKTKYQNVTPFSKMFGIDCEMCLTAVGDSELTRVSLVDEEHKIYYDTLVKPKNKIIDYLTKFSGITHKMMKSVTTTLEDVQADLVRLLPKDAILVGQSLGNDLHALKMMHPYCIDTSVIYNLTGDRTRKTKLKTLSAEFLSERIQEGKSGHCSTEDSIASLKLAQLKLSKNLNFGDAVLGSIQHDIRQTPELGSYNYATSMLRQVTKIDKSAQVVGINDIPSKYKCYVDKGNSSDVDEKINFYSEKSPSIVFGRLCETMIEYSLNIGHVKMQTQEMHNKTIFKSIDKWVEDVHKAAPADALILVAFLDNKSNGCCFIDVKKDSA